MVVAPTRMAGWSLEVKVSEVGRICVLRRIDGARLRWALLSDLHLAEDAAAEYGGVRPDENAVRTVRDAAAWAPQGALVNGDLAFADGLAGDYRRCRERLAPLAVCPLVLAPGNHDRREGMLAEFASGGSAEKVITVVETPAVRIVALDSLYRVDVVPGLVGRAQREWLAEFLDRADKRPTVVCVHHPLTDEDGALLDGDRLLAVLQPRSQVKAVFTGHDHVWKVERRGQLHVVALPAVGMPFDPAEAIGWVAAEFRPDGVLLDFRATAPGHGGGSVRLRWRPS